MVYSSPDDGYGASMTSTGSRVAEKIKNLPYSIEVITSEMMDDLAFTDLGEDFAYVSSFGGFDAGSGNINLRGLGVGKQLRNGFLRIGVIDKANIERIEVIKGPSAAIYGESLPAGLINIVTKKPKTKPAYKLTTRVGTNDLFRVDAEACAEILAGFRRSTPRKTVSAAITRQPKPLASMSSVRMGPFIRRSAPHS